MKLEGSLDNVNWVEVDAGGADKTELHSSTNWWLYYRIVLSSLTGENATIDAWIGAGGA